MRNIEDEGGHRGFFNILPPLLPLVMVPGMPETWVSSTHNQPLKNELIDYSYSIFDIFFSIIKMISLRQGHCGILSVIIKNIKKVNFGGIYIQTIISWHLQNRNPSMYLPGYITITTTEPLYDA